MLATIKALPRFTLINCWHENPHESAAMWKLYSKDDSGIVIKTNFDPLERVLRPANQSSLGKIDYIDYDTADIFGRDKWWFQAFLCKRRIFQHEREVRAIVQIIPPGKRILPAFIKHEGTEGVIDLSQDICDVGNYYEVDLSLLIKEVIVGPYAPDWLIELVQSVASLQLNRHQ